MDYLAWYMYPQPGGTTYTQTQLADPAVVEQLFDYCQIGLAIISAQGWDVLVRAHGVDGLLAINRRSGWFDEDCALEELRARCRSDGYELGAADGGDRGASNDRDPSSLRSSR